MCSFIVSQSLQYGRALTCYFFFPMNTSEMPTLKLQSLSARVFGEIRTETYNPSERQVEPQEFRIVYMCLIYIYLTRFSVTEIRVSGPGKRKCGSPFLSYFRLYMSFLRISSFFRCRCL
jgi:hypothetical protein